MRTKPNVIGRVVLVVEAPFSERDLNRFGVRSFVHNGLQVQVWEVQDVYTPRPRGESVPRATGVSVRRFTSESDLVESASRLSAGDCVITTVGTYIGQEKSLAPLVEAIGSSDALFTTIASGHRIHDAPTERDGSRIRSLGSLALALRLDLQSNPRRVPVVLRSAWRNRRTGTSSPPRALDAIWAGTTVESVRNDLIDERTKILFIHTLDYDLVRASRSLSPGPAVGKIVYLDTMGPEHPDYPVLGRRVITKPADWFASVRSAMGRIEATLGMEIAVVPHPRANPEETAIRYGHREVLTGSTAHAIRDSAFVLITDSTTSLGMVAALGKPCLALLTPMVHSQSHSRLAAYAHALGITVVDHDSIPDGLAVPLRDSEKQARFVNDFVKRKGTPEQDFWDFVAEQITTWER